MWVSAITAYFHYLGFMLAFVALTVEISHLKKEMTLDEAKRVIFADAAYGLAATIILATGVLRVLYFGKGTDYYLHNPFFYAKMSIFVLVSFFSLYPTFTFLSWIKGIRFEQPTSLDITQVNRLSWLIKGELFGFILLPLLAAIMARISA